MSAPCTCNEWPEIAKALVWLTPEDDESLRMRPFLPDTEGEPIYVLFCPACGGEAPQRMRPRLAEFVLGTTERTDG